MTGSMDGKDEGRNALDEPETSSFLSNARDTPLKVAVGLYLVGVAAFAILGVAFLT